MIMREMLYPYKENKIKYMRIRLYKFLSYNIDVTRHLDYTFHMETYEVFFT